jgi:hypothetical protein
MERLPPHHLTTTGPGPIAPMAHRRLMLKQCTWPHAQHPTVPALRLIWPQGTKARGEHPRKPIGRPLLRVVKPLRDAEHIIGRW